MKKKLPLAFCSLSLTLSSLLMRGLKLVGSLRKVIRSKSKKVFIPESKLCGLCAVVYTRAEEGGPRGRGGRGGGGEGGVVAVDKKWEGSQPGGGDHCDTTGHVDEKRGALRNSVCEIWDSMSRVHTSSKRRVTRKDGPHGARMARTRGKRKMWLIFSFICSGTYTCKEMGLMSHGSGEPWEVPRILESVGVPSSNTI